MLSLFSQAIPICTMTIYRDSLESSGLNYEYRDGNSFTLKFKPSFWEINNNVTNFRNTQNQFRKV